MQRLQHGSLIEQTENGARFALDDRWECRVYLLRDDLARVLFTPPGGLREPRTWAIVTDEDVPWTGRERVDVEGFPCPGFSFAATDQLATLRTSALTVRVRLVPFGITWLLADGTPFASDRGTDAYQWRSANSTVRHYMTRDRAADRYFGLGDKTGPLDLHGRRLRTLAVDALGYDAETGDPLYKHWPYLIVRDGGGGVAYGLYYDTLAPATFDLGCEHDNYHGFYRYCEIEDGDLDYYLFVGPAIRDVVRKFAQLTGPMAFGPRWSLGYANTAMSLTDAPDAQARLSSFIEDVARHDVPISAFHFGSGYSSRGKRRYVFTWNREKFPDPKSLIDQFEQSRIKLVANIKPCLLDDHPAYDRMASTHAFVNHASTGVPCVGQFWDGEGAHVDFTNRDGVRWWQESLRDELLDYGILGWNDNNEYEIWDDDGVSAGFGAPIPITRSRPLHALLMSRATFDAQSAHAPDVRTFTVTRAGPPGIQRYAQTWSGDNTTSWHNMRWNLRMGLTMGLSGMFNTGHDVGGFFGPVPEPELLVRWVQCTAFNPRFVMNSWKAGGEVNTPWMHPEVLPVVRDWLRLRYRMMPYLYSLYARAARSHEPMLRPLFYDFPDDPNAYDDTDEFLVGPNLLVAPVVEAGARRRHVYLPKGPAGWLDFWSGTYHADGRTFDTDAPLERMPMFVPAGGMILTTDSDDMARKHDEPSRALRVFPGRGRGKSMFSFYEDDGATLLYREGDYAELECTLTWSSREVHVRLRKQGRYALPYDSVRIITPFQEQRRVKILAEGVNGIASG